MSPDLKARKSVIFPKVDDLIYKQKLMDIGEKIIKENDWINEDSFETSTTFTILQ